MQHVINVDPNRTVLAEIILPYIGVIGLGRNRFVCDHSSTASRWDKEKYHWVMHAEEQAIHDAYQRRGDLKGAHMRVNYFPCARCANHIVVAGIKQVTAPVPDISHHRWGRDWQIAMQIFEEAGVVVSSPD